MISYTENPKEQPPPKKKTSRVIEFKKKFHMRLIYQKSIFLYITNEQSEKKTYNSTKNKEFKRTAKLML